eukprot:1639541-Pyramimonas_sp.AAC.1
MVSRDWVPPVRNPEVKLVPNVQDHLSEALTNTYLLWSRAPESIVLGNSVEPEHDTVQYTGRGDSMIMRVTTLGGNNG